MKLQQVDNRTVAVQLNQGERQTVLHGRARYEHQPGLGNVLRVAVSDAAGDFDLIFEEDRWDGLIEPDHQSGYDYRLVVTVMPSS